MIVEKYLRYIVQYAAVKELSREKEEGKRRRELVGFDFGFALLEIAP